jgi:hypothetical protein
MRSESDRKLTKIDSLKSLTLPFTYTAPPTPFCVYPESAFSKVDLPAPDGPMMAIKFPLGKVPLTLWRISFWSENETNSESIRIPLIIRESIDNDNNQTTVND